MTNHLKLLLVTLSLALLGMPNLAASAQQKEFRQTVALEPGGDLTLKTDKGSVRLISWDQPQVEIYARFEPPEGVSDDYGRRAVEAARVEVTGGGRALTIRSNFDDVPYQDGILHGSRSLPHIHYEVRAPRRLNLDLNLDRCRAELAGFSGKISLKTDRTPVTARDLAGEVRVSMDRGRVTLSGLQGSLDLKTDRTDSRLDAVRIEGDSALHISRGECELRLPAVQGLTLSANTGRREYLESDFAVTASGFSRSSIEGTINGGGPRLTVHTDRSVVRLRRTS